MENGLASDSLNKNRCSDVIYVLFLRERSDEGVTRLRLSFDLSRLAMLWMGVAE